MCWRKTQIKKIWLQKTLIWTDLRIALMNTTPTLESGWKRQWRRFALKSEIVCNQLVMSQNFELIVLSLLFIQFDARVSPKIFVFLCPARLFSVFSSLPTSVNYFPLSTNTNLSDVCGHIKLQLLRVLRVDIGPLTNCIARSPPEANSHPVHQQAYTPCPYWIQRLFSHLRHWSIFYAMFSIILRRIAFL
jgi:hypothetical protein